MTLLQLKHITTRIVTRKVTCEVEQNLHAYKTVELDSLKKVVKYCFTLDQKPNILKFNNLLKVWKRKLSQKIMKSDSQQDCTCKEI